MSLPYPLGERLSRVESLLFSMNDEMFEELIGKYEVLTKLSEDVSDYKYMYVPTIPRLPDDVLAINDLNQNLRQRIVDLEHKVDELSSKLSYLSSMVITLSDK